MKYYPVYLDLRGRPCLVIGGGTVAERKVQSLLEAGAVVTVVSPTLTSKLLDLSRSGTITHRPKKIEENDLSRAFLVIAATNSPGVNTFAAQACKKKNILVNVVVPPVESSFIVPSVVERGDLLIAVSTSGASPALARKIRLELEANYGTEYALFLETLADIREQVLEKVPDEQKRKMIFQAIADSDVIDLLKQGRIDDANQRLTEISGVKTADR